MKDNVVRIELSRSEVKTIIECMEFYDDNLGLEDDEIALKECFQWLRDNWGC